MFRKILICWVFATAAGYCFAAGTLPQVVTSEVFYEDDYDVAEQEVRQDFNYVAEQEFVPVAVPVQPIDIPAWPLSGSDADVTAACGDATCAPTGDNIRVVSKIGDDLIVENNFNLGGRGEEWSGGANMLHGNQIPVGFADECASGSEMPLLHREMLEDDGGAILTVSRSGRKNCNNYSDRYTAFMAKNGMVVATESVDENASGTETVSETTEIAVDASADAEPAPQLTDQVRSWVVANGQTLREVLQSWCDKEGWDLVWATPREYPIQASAVFKGRFVDVASALVRNFGRAHPIPYAKFYKGNRVLVISTNEE